MQDNIMSNKKFWIIRFRDKLNGHDEYVVDTNPMGNRHSWWATDCVDDAYHFNTRGQANKALRSPIWQTRGYTRASEYAIEVVEVRERITKTWTELQVISNENALIQLAHLGETDEHDHDGED